MRYKTLNVIWFFLIFSSISNIWASRFNFPPPDTTWEPSSNKKRSLEDYPTAGPIVPPGARVKFDEKIGLLTVTIPNEKIRLCLEQINLQEDEKDEFEDMFYEFSSYEHPLLVDYIKKLQSDNLSHSSILSKLDKVSFLSCTNRKFITERLQSLIYHEIRKFEEYDLMEALSFVPVRLQNPDLELFIKDIEPFIKQSMTSEDLLEIIKATAPILASERQDLLKDVQPLVKDTMKGEDVAYIIKMARTLPYKERQALTSILQPLVKEEMTGKEVGFLLRQFQFKPSSVNTLKNK